MILGRTPEGLIKTKSDSPLGLRAINCTCCGGGCNFRELYDSGVRSITLNYFGGGFPTGNGVCESSCPVDEYSTQIQNSTGPNGIYVLDYYESSQPSFGTSAQYFAFDFVVFFGCDCSQEYIRQPQYWFPYVACFNGGKAWRLVVLGGGFGPTITAYVGDFTTPPKNGQVIDGKFSLSW